MLMVQVYKTWGKPLTVPLVAFVTCKRTRGRQALLLPEPCRSREVPGPPLVIALATSADQPHLPRTFLQLRT